ncbi:hypothetical protein IYX23_13805 [Methylocystis sp. L43]|jgi:hypothetical protein|uniref:hypothetical protein n=1 Tax=unclassified Methylocystis TaxID=2625913 RepID=UPI0018C25F57|nr:MULTISPECIES: hypothetical protein [unclassified Methylocystis]MBG0798744.1 hypothetical protein [Methylocystis sp. L43]MBG0806251.1 hypothetical protein [Methylocystis sp. H15]
MIVSKTERRAYYFVLTMVVLSFVIIGVLPLFRLAQYLWPQDSGHDITAFVLSAPRQNQLLNLNQLFSADTICIVPPEANINEYIRRALPEKQIPVPGDDDDYEDNVARWRIVASWDATRLVKVFDVWSTTTSKRKYPLELSAKDRDALGAICSRRLRLKIETINGEVTATVQ